MSAITPLRDAIRLRLRRIVVERGLTYEALAIRTGLNRRTVERFLEGETFAAETADTIATALRVPWEPTDEILAGLTTWQLRGKRGWWARAKDLADWMGLTRSALCQRTLRGLRLELIERDQVEGNVRAEHVVPSATAWQTRANHGCTMLSTKACLWLVLTSESEVGLRALGGLIDEGVERTRSAKKAARR